MAGKDYTNYDKNNGNTGEWENKGAFHFGIVAGFMADFLRKCKGIGYRKNANSWRDCTEKSSVDDAIYTWKL